MSQNPVVLKTSEPIAPVKPKTPTKQAPVEQPNARPRSPAPQPATEVKPRPVTPTIVQPAKQPNSESAKPDSANVSCLLELSLFCQLPAKSKPIVSCPNTSRNSKSVGLGRATNSRKC